MIKIKIMINKTKNIFLLIYFFNICIYLRNISQNKIELFKKLFYIVESQIIWTPQKMTYLMDLIY